MWLTHWVSRDKSHFLYVIVITVVLTLIVMKFSLVPLYEGQLPRTTTWESEVTCTTHTLHLGPLAQAKTWLTWCVRDAGTSHAQGKSRFSKMPNTLVSKKKRKEKVGLVFVSSLKFKLKRRNGWIYRLVFLAEYRTYTGKMREIDA